jgi:predicted DNA-binding transcriptional regulator AlpA
VDEQHEWLKVPEVAELLRVARSRAYELVANGEIPAVKRSSPGVSVNSSKSVFSSTAP